MKKGGILNAQLMEELTALGHFDAFVICDMGFPIPRDAAKIDLALVKGVPTFIQTLKAVLSEIIVQEVILMEKIKEVNKDQNERVCGLLTKQEIRYMSFEDFRAQSEKAKFFIRTAECTRASNIILVTASGADIFVEKYNINP